MPKIFARDSVLWSVLFYVGMVLSIALPLISDPAAYGIHPIVYRWLLLINAVVTGVSGKLGMSPVELARNLEQPK